MAIYLVQARLGHDSGLPEDVTVNTWSCVTSSVDPLEGLADFIDEVKGFYLSIDEHLSSKLSGSLEFRAYDRNDPEPRTPVLIVPETITPGTTAMPGQVAIVASFEAAPTSGSPQARRRGRVYIGPLSAATLNTSTGGPTTAVVGAVSDAALALATAGKAAAGWSWTVWSQVDEAGRQVDRGWVDDGWDTQRRRKIAATARDSWTTL